MIYVVADERDVIRVRTNFRHGEDISLYRTTITPAQARERFHEYVRSLNQIRDHPRWYNAITTNCTTSIRTSTPLRNAAVGLAHPPQWQRRRTHVRTPHVAPDRLPFAELKARLINPAAQAADDAPDFSAVSAKTDPGFRRAEQRHTFHMTACRTQADRVPERPPDFRDD